jgi:hypothetical protein
MAFLLRLAYIGYDKESKSIFITNDGVNALKDGDIQNLANNTFGGLVSIHIQFFCIVMSLIALIISILNRS